MTNKELRAIYEDLVRQREGDPELYSWNTIPYTLLSILTKTEQKSIKILEVGCARGQLSDYLMVKGFDVIATDFNMVSLRIGQQMHPNLQLICADAEELPFRESEFDVIISVEVIEHLPDVDRHLHEVRRVLKGGGKYMISTPNKFIERIYDLARKKDHCSLHLSSQTLFSLRKSLIKFGFRPTFYSMTKLPPSQIRKIRNSMIERMVKGFPVWVIPRVLQPSLNCIAELVKE